MKFQAALDDSLLQHRLSRSNPHRKVLGPELMRIVRFSPTSYVQIAFIACSAQASNNYSEITEGSVDEEKVSQCRILRNKMQDNRVGHIQQNLQLPGVSIAQR